MEFIAAHEQNMNIVVFSDDWGRHPSSCQHIFSHFFKISEIERIIWVNTIGTRPPRLDFLTLRRGMGKILQWGGVGKKRGTPPGEFQDSRSSSGEAETNCPEVCNPLMLPWFRRPLDRKINRYLLKKAILSVLKDVRGPVVAVTTLPIVADVVGEGFPDSPISRWLYYCVDDWSQWPGADSVTMEKMEKDLVAKADVIVTAGLSLQERIRGLGRESVLLTHGVDLTHWQTPAPAKLDFLADAQPPFYTFWGLIDERMEIAFVKRLADDIPEGKVIMTGPTASSSILAQLTHPNILTPGNLNYDQLPALAAISDVLIMPYRDIPVTQQMQPLKMTEYLATGRPAVVRRLPACEAWADAMDLVENAVQFSEIAQLRAKTGIPDAQKAARLRLAQESWAGKARQFKEILFHGK